MVNLKLSRVSGSVGAIKKEKLFQLERNEQIGWQKDYEQWALTPIKCSNPAGKQTVSASRSITYATKF
jgi:hypothetical protein